MNRKVFYESGVLVAERTFDEQVATGCLGSVPAVRVALRQHTMMLQYMGRGTAENGRCSCALNYQKDPRQRFITVSPGSRCKK